MERKMFFANRKMEKKDAEELLRNNKIASLAVIGDDGHPYVVPIHYIYDNGAIYFHSAKYGYKMDAIDRDPRVCLSVMGETEILKEKFTATFESLVVDGIAEYVEDPAERERVLKEMIIRWIGEFNDAATEMIDKTIGRTAVIRVKITSLSGKVYRG